MVFVLNRCLSSAFVNELCTGQKKAYLDFKKNVFFLNCDIPLIDNTGVSSIHVCGEMLILLVIYVLEGSY